MKALVVIILGLSLLVAGCAHTMGYAGKNPGYIKCSGKGTITGTGSASAGAGIGGSEMNNFSITADCGDGFTFEQGMPGMPVHSNQAPAR